MLISSIIATSSFISYASAYKDEKPLLLLGPFDESMSSGFVIKIQTNQSQTDSDTISIPGWVKKTAGWWAGNQVEDKDFVQGIQYLIQKGIMKIPQTKSSDSKSSQQIPSWIKSNAGWWADGKISDSDFVLGIQYLISKGIMNVEPSPTPSKKDPGGYY